MKTTNTWDWPGGRVVETLVYSIFWTNVHMLLLRHELKSTIKALCMDEKNCLNKNSFLVAGEQPE